MSDRINIAELRERHPRGVNGERGVIANLAQWELLALLDAVEAAHGYIAVTDARAANNRELNERLTRGETVAMHMPVSLRSDDADLRDALARFDFGDET